MACIYIMSNVSYTGLLKIGSTRRTAFERARELTTTGVPTPFKVEATWECDDGAAERLERQIHQRLSRYRYSNNREFFALSLATAKDEIGDFFQKECDAEIARKAALALRESASKLLRTVEEEHSRAVIELAAALKDKKEQICNSLEMKLPAGAVVSALYKAKGKILGPRPVVHKGWDMNVDSDNRYVCFLIDTVVKTPFGAPELKQWIIGLFYLSPGKRLSENSAADWLNKWFGRTVFPSRLSELLGATAGNEFADYWSSRFGSKSAWGLIKAGNTCPACKLGTLRRGPDRPYERSHLRCTADNGCHLVLPLFTNWDDVAVNDSSGLGITMAEYSTLRFIPEANASKFGNVFHQGSGGRKRIGLGGLILVLMLVVLAKLVALAVRVGY